MEKTPIPRAVAKTELERINSALSQPHLLIGGLAVQQYYTARDSKDIDLVCSFETAQRILDHLYPSRDWRVIDKQNDEYRPSFQIRHRVKDVGTIIFGPKISERKPYSHIDWELLKEDARPFVIADRSLQNILVPSVHGLAYTKFLSFLGRHAPEDKVRADLKDFADLTNHESFSVSLFFDLLRRSEAYEELVSSFRAKCVECVSILEGSCLAALAPMFIPESSQAHSQLQSPPAGTAEQIDTLPQRLVTVQPVRIFVSSADDLIKAIGPDRVIQLSSGVYDLSSVPDRYMKYVRWHPVFDGRTVTIRNVENLRIEGDAFKPTKLIVSPRYAHVLIFDKCVGIDICDVTMGHKRAGYCYGGVLSFIDSQEIQIQRCKLFGCGTEGLRLKVVRTFRMVDGDIFDCTYGIATIESSKDIRITSTTFRNNKEFWGICIRDSEYVEFQDVNVVSNQCRDELFEVVSSWPVRFIRGRVDHNHCKRLGNIETQESTIQSFPFTGA